MKNSIFILLLLASASFSYAQVPNYVPSNGLVGWWPFNGNAVDSSGTGNNGAVNGATLTTDRNGQANRAYLFDGNDHIVVTRSLSIEPASQITYSCWVLMNTGFNGSTFFAKSYQIGNSSYQFAISTGGISGGATFGGANLTTTVVQNRWYFVVQTFDGSTCKLYIDGVLVNSAPSTGNLIYNTNNLYIGISNMPTVPVLYFNGKIDDIGIWNRALNAQEVSNLFTATNCSNNLSISPSQNNVQRGNTATFTATTSDPNPSIIWQSDLGQGFQTLNNIGNYSGTNTATMNIANVQLSEHNQPVRAISTSGNCVDTSSVSTITILDSCITTIYDTITTSIAVTDTLIINAVLSGVNPPNNNNTLLVYPNPARTHITIDNGNFALMNGYTVRINNTLGQTVFTQAVNQQQFFIDLSTWTGNGLYYLDLIDNSGNSIETKVIVVQ